MLDHSNDPTHSATAAFDIERLGLTTLVSDCVEDNARWAPDATAMVFNERTRSWAEFADEVQRLRQGLANQGVIRGSRVALLDRNSDDGVLLHYALAGMGAVLVPINMWLRAHEVAYILATSQPSLLVTSAEFLKLAVDASQKLLDAPRLLVRDAKAGDTLCWQELLEGSARRPISKAQSWNDAHLILHTSGTTGRPKGAIIAHRRTVINTASSLSAFDIRAKERLYCYTPLFHTGAWDYIGMYFLQRGSVVLADRYEPEQAVRDISQHQCNGMWSVPRVLREMVESSAWQTSDVSSMRLIAYSNFDPSSLILRIVDAFRERGAQQITIVNAYGMTEAGCFISLLRPADSMFRPLSIGTPVPGVQLALLDDAMNEVARGAVGEICVRTPAVMSGYLNRPEATAEAFAGGWLHTGDLAKVDEEGFLYLVDRKKEMIRSGGENIFPKEVEQVLAEHPGVRDCAVIGLPDDDYGERVVAVVVVDPVSKPDEAELIAFVRQRIAGFKTPRQVIFRSELPKTPAGKLKKHELRDALLK